MINQFFQHIGAGALAILVSVMGFVGFVPKESSYSATIATTSISDTLGAFRTKTNLSLENINNQLNTVSSSVSGLGNISLENSPLSANKGGTSTTTIPLKGRVAVGNGTGLAYRATSTDGLFLRSSSTDPLGVDWGAVAVDQTANYTWTGSHVFASSTTFATGTVTFATSSTLKINTTTTFSQAVNFNIKPLSNFITYFSPTTTTWTVPSNVTTIYITGCGAGGGGGGGAGNGGSGSGGGGGGGGGGVCALFQATTTVPNSSLSVSLGNGGIGGLGCNGGGCGTGTTGSSTIIGGITLNGGTGGVGGATNAGGAGGTYGGSAAGTVNTPDLVGNWMNLLSAGGRAGNSTAGKTIWGYQGTNGLGGSCGTNGTDATGFGNGGGGMGGSNASTDCGNGGSNRGSNGSGGFLIIQW